MIVKIEIDKTLKLIKISKKKNQPVQKSLCGFLTSTPLKVSNVYFKYSKNIKSYIILKTFYKNF